jgi:hypothetical protein
MAKIVKRKISWGASTAADTTGYKLYWSVGEGATLDYNSDNADVGNVTSVIIPDDIPTFPLVEDIINVGATAYDDMGNESDMTVINAPFDFTAPDAPTNLVVTAV